MNKTIIIAGGASIASLAAGVAGGYFFAKKKFQNELDIAIATELDKTKKHYSILLMEAKAGKSESVLDAVQNNPNKVEEPSVVEGHTVTPASEKTVENGKAALTNYQQFAKAEDDEIVINNIFDKNKPKKRLPPRDPSTGRFGTPKKPEPELTPYIITEEDFLTNDPEHEQESVLYFANEDTAVMAADFNDVVDNGRIGEVNLTLFPEDEDPSVIYVRNEGLGMDYQVTKTTDSLTEAMGLDDGEEDLADFDEYAGLNQD